MKMTTLKSVAIAVGLASSAFGQATSPVVGYETLNVQSGFNYLGLRLHEAPEFTGTFDSSTATSLTDSNADFSTSGDGLYLFELANGTVVEVPGSSLAGDTISGLTGITAADEGAYTARPSATLASIFGEDNSAGLAAGTFGTSGADQVWIPNGTGGFIQYYYDTFNANSSTATWSELAAPNNAVDANEIPLVYVDGILLVKDAGSPLQSIVVAGDLKTTPTSYALRNGFNYLSSISPAGATLATAFGTDNSAGLAAGTFGTSGADQVWNPNGSGGFDQYYFDNFNANSSTATWSELAAPNNAIDATSVELESGFIIVANADSNTTAQVPDFYAGL